MVIKALGISTALTLFVLTLSIDFVILVEFTQEMWVNLFKLSGTMLGLFTFVTWAALVKSQ